MADVADALAVRVADGSGRVLDQLRAFFAKLPELTRRPPFRRTRLAESPRARSGASRRRPVGLHLQIE